MSFTKLAHDIDKDLRTQDVRISQNITFDNLLLSEDTIKGLTCSGFQKPSPIQLHAIPLGKCGFDLLLEAKSGTGKTAVFSIIALEKIDLRKGLQTVILAPTREIAAQICEVIKQIGANYEGLKVEVVMGGLPVQDDIAKFNKKDVHIVVGSPGRLRHLIHDKHINTAHVRLLVLDEADKLVEKSFQADINYIFAVLPKQKQVIMSSATYPETARVFIENYVQCAQHICPETNSVLLGVEQRMTTVKFNSNIVKQTQHRFEELLKILSGKPFKQCLIFCNYQARVVELHKLLTKHKWPAEQLYGQQEQTDRLDALKTLQEYKCRILISSDLAARGIDASNVDLVINFEPPFEWQTYLHRIGRAGRFGSYGTAVSILSEGREEDKFKSLLGSINVLEKVANYWSEKIIDHSESNLTSKCNEKVTESNLEPEAINTKEKAQKVWELLSAKIDSNARKIDTFESLCQEFQESCNTGYEQFSDLISSFESFQKENSISEATNESVYEENTTFKLWKAKVEEVNNCTRVELNKYLDVAIRNQHNLNNNTAITPNKLATHHSIASNLEELKGQERNLVIKSNQNHKADIVESDDDHKDSDYNVYSIEEAALREAGLPTAFGKQSFEYHKKNIYNFIAKKKVNHKPMRKRYENRYKSKYETTSDEDTEEEDLTSLYFAKMTTKSQNVDSTEDYGYTTLSNQCKSRNNLPSNSSNNKHRRKKQHSTTAHTKYDYENKFQHYGYGYFRNTNAAFNEDYNNWYNQLKFTVKQIEQSVYINEMVKLNFK